MRIGGAGAGREGTPLTDGDIEDPDKEALAIVGVDAAEVLLELGGRAEVGIGGGGAAFVIGAFFRDGFITAITSSVVAYKGPVSSRLTASDAPGGGGGAVEGAEPRSHGRS